MIMPLIKLQPKRIIIDIDTQKHFFSDRGVSCVQNYLSVLANIRRVVAWARLKDVRMVSTVQIYSDINSYRDFCFTGMEGQRKIRYTIRNKHTSLAATDSTDLPVGILDRYEQVILHKRCFDPFEEPRADRMLSELRADEFIVIGATIEEAVKATVLGLLARRKSVTLLVDATGSFDNSAAKRALRYIWAKGAKLTDTKTLLGSSCLRLVGMCGYNRGRVQITGRAGIDYQG
ncbi:MAG: cysteine hydrolase family protein [Planctomycetota bacterium]